MASASAAKQHAGVLARATVYLAALVAYLKLAPEGAEAFTAFCAKLGVPQAMGALLLGVPVAFALLDLGREGLRRLSQRELRRRGAQALEDYRPGYFRLAPFGASEEDRSTDEARARPDGLEGELVDWLATRTEPVLYLTGDSGTGKSSLLSASVLPRLREREGAPRVVEVRIFADPIADLTRALLAPGAVWSRPSQGGDDPLATLRLKAHPRKCVIRRTDEGLPFLGYVVWPDRIRVRGETVRRYRRRLRRDHELDAQGRARSLDAWRGHVRLAGGWRHGHGLLGAHVE